MLVALHDADKTLPTLALMKLSGWHKSHGDIVKEASHMKRASYRSSFTPPGSFPWTAEEEKFAGNTIRGGTGYGLLHELDAEIEAFEAGLFTLSGFYIAWDFTTRMHSFMSLVHCSEKKGTFLDPTRKAY